MAKSQVRISWIFTAVVFASWLCLASASTASAFKIVGLFQVNTPGVLAPAADGRVWFGDIVYPHGTAAVGLTALAANGTQSSIALEKPEAATMSERPPVSVDAKGFIWTAAYRANRRAKATLYRVAPSGKFRVFNLVFRSIRSLVAGPNGQTWFFGNDRHRIGRIGPSGRVTYMAFDRADELLSMVRGPSSTMWAMSAKSIFRISKSGLVKRFRAPSGTSGDIAYGRDGYMWATAGSSLMRLSTHGARKFVSIFNPGTALSPRYAVAVTRGIDGPIAYLAASVGEYPREGGRVEQPSFGLVDATGRVSETPPSPETMPTGATDFDIWWQEGEIAPPQMTPGAQQLVAGVDGKYWISGALGLWEMDPAGG